MSKLFHLLAGEWRKHSHSPSYQLLRTDDQSARVLATAPGGDPAVLARLASCLAPPFHLLYVLHTPRGEGEPGRYESPAISAAELTAFIDRFGRFLRADARYDLWVHSPEDEATVVWDRHNLVHAYGPVMDYVQVLHGLGFQAGCPEVPLPHEHHYQAAMDEDARALLRWLDWHRKPLHPWDEQ